MRIIKLAFLSLFSFFFLSLPALAGPSPGDKITDFAINKLNGLFDAVKTAMPTVTKYTLQATQLGCLADLLYGGALFILDLVSIGVFFWVINWFRKKLKDNTIENDAEAPLAIVNFCLALVTGGASVILFIASLSYLLDFWSWICVAHPDAYLIHLAVQKIVH